MMSFFKQLELNYASKQLHFIFVVIALDSIATSFSN